MMCIGRVSAWRGGSKVNKWALARRRQYCHSDSRDAGHVACLVTQFDLLHMRSTAPAVCIYLDVGQLFRPLILLAKSYDERSLAPTRKSCMLSSRTSMALVQSLLTGMVLLHLTALSGALI